MDESQAERLVQAQEAQRKAIERIANALEGQKPSKANQILATIASGATAASLFNIVELFVKFLRGG